MLGERITVVDVLAPVLALGGVAYMVGMSETINSQQSSNEVLGATLIFISALLSGMIAV